MVRFSRSPSCFSSCALSASKVMAPRLSTSASSKSAIVRSSTWSSLNFMPFSSMQARITCCSSLCWIRPSPETNALVLKSLCPRNYLTVQIVDFEEEPDFVVSALTCELMHGLDELLQRDGSRVVLVEDLEDALREEGLQPPYMLTLCV